MRECGGIGHVKGPIFQSHDTPFGCPYSEENYDKDPGMIVPDRISFDVEKKTEGKPNQGHEFVEQQDLSPVIYLDTDETLYPSAIPIVFDTDQGRGSC